jgi:glycosyltransferase involved in cell wall biosynthesis
MNISVVIPAYNAESVIIGAIESVVAQCRPEITEIIVVNDASIDSTSSVTKTFKDSKVKVVDLEKNHGPAAARNRGIEVATGEWVAFLDADDRWLPGKIEAQIQLASQHPDLSLLCTGVKGGHEPCDVSILELADFVTHNPVATSTVMVKRSSVQAVDGFDERFSGAEDLDLWLRLLATGECRVGKINEMLVRYHSHEGSLSMDERKFLPDSLAVLEKAFGAGGALESFADKKDLAMANQYWNASWMAFNRGARGTAIHLWRKGHKLAGGELKRPWYRLLCRYLLGRR